MTTQIQTCRHDWVQANDIKDSPTKVCSKCGKLSFSDEERTNKTKEFVRHNNVADREITLENFTSNVEISSPEVANGLSWRIIPPTGFENLEPATISRDSIVAISGASTNDMRTYVFGDVDNEW